MYNDQIFNEGLAGLGRGGFHLLRGRNFFHWFWQGKFSIKTQRLWRTLENTYSEILTIMPLSGPGLVLQKIPSKNSFLGSGPGTISYRLSYKRARSVYFLESRIEDGRTDKAQTIAYFFKIWKYAKNGKNFEFIFMMFHKTIIFLVLIHDEF